MTYYSLHNICPMRTRLPAKTDTVVVTRNVHLEQVAEVVGVPLELLRSLNPMYRRDIVPGASEPYPIRLPQTEVSKFLDLEDSVYNYRADELLAKRAQVEINDDVPTYYHKKKRTVRGKRGRVVTRRTAATKRRTTAAKRRTTTAKRKTTARKRTTTKRRRR
jgi:membrane-bound lytic murein transglycosylase D